MLLLPWQEECGTRLGYNGPKGTFLVNITPKPKYIFEILANTLEQANKKFEVSYGDENFLILDDGYTWIQIIPTSKHYTVTIMYNNEKEIVQWYIDITNMNGIDSDE